MTALDLPAASDKVNWRHARKGEIRMQDETQKSPGDDLSATVVELAALLNYQEAAVVSRTLVKKSTGTVTLFAFDKGQELSEHTAPFDALVHVLEGEAEITISGKAMSVSAGQMVIMPANEPHALKAVQPYKMLLVMIRQ